VAGVKQFEDLAAWRFSVELSEAIDDITKNARVLQDSEFRKQIVAAADAAAPLIAEGFLRFTTPEIVRYLRMARAELAEVQTHLTIGAKKNYFTAEQLQRVWPLANRAMGTTTNFLKSKLRQLEEEQRRKRNKRRTRRRPGPGP
jgi:four helix bundle protein